MSTNYKIIISFIVIGIFFISINILTPEYLDDYLYKFVFKANGADKDSPIRSCTDVLISQYNHYFCFNGRIFVHSFVQLFSGIWGKGIFNCFNTCVFLLFTYELTKTYGKVSCRDLFFCASLIFLLLPAFNDTALWMTGSINYLWTCTFVCGFILLLESLKDKIISINHLFYLILGLLIGWTHEGITFPLSLSLIIYICIYFKKIQKKAAFPLVIGFILGSFLCTFSPATLNRGSIDSSFTMSMLQQKIISGISLMGKLKAFYILILSSCFYLVYNKHNNPKLCLKNFYLKNIVLWNALILSFGIIFFSGFISSRTAIGVEFFSILLFLKLLDILNNKFLIIKHLKTLLCLICTLLYGMVFYYSILNYKESKSIFLQLKSKKEIIVTNEITKPHWTYRYIREPLINSKNDYYDHFIIGSPWNSYIEKTYDCEPVIFIPQNIYLDIKKRNANIFDIKKQQKYAFYVIPDKTISDDEKVVFILKPTEFDKLPLYKRRIAHLQARYTLGKVNATRIGKVSIEGHNYLLIGKNSMINNRVNSILITHNN